LLYASRVIRFLLLLLLLAGCTSLAGSFAPDARLTFPDKPVRVDATGRYFDVDGNGVVDFAVDGESLRYDDDEDGTFDRVYRFADYETDSVPHLLLLIDSLPFRKVQPRYAAGEWNWFHPPQLVIPPFPSLSEVTFSAILGAPPMGGAIERYYDKRDNEIHNLYTARIWGYKHPWQQRVHGQLRNYREVGYSYLNPRPWFHAELQRAKETLDTSPDRFTTVYIVSSSAMVSRYGAEGLDECLDRVEQLCLQLLHERRGALKITIISDHGHNLMASPNFLVAAALEQAGFRVAESIEDPAKDVVPEIDGLVTYFGVHTKRPVAVADAMLPHAEVQLAMYMDGSSVVVRDKNGSARIDKRDGRFRYTPQEDVLAYGDLANRWMTGDEWMEATAHGEWPDGPRRIWEAFHALVVSPADVMFTLNDGHCAGMPSMEKWIDMQSTHGGLNHVNSDAVVLSMVRALPEPLRSREVLPALFGPTYSRGVGASGETGR